MKKLLKRLMEDNVLDFQALVLRYYHKLDLTEVEAIALIKLHRLLNENEHVIKPTKFSKWLSLDSKETDNVLSNLIEKGYLSIVLIEQEDGKEKESFSLDFFLTKVIDMIEKDAAKHQESTTAELVDFLETTLQKPLTHLDVEWIKKWLEEDAYSMEMIKDATLEVAQKGRITLKNIDQLLIKKLSAVPKTKAQSKIELEDFYKLWEE